MNIFLSITPIFALIIIGHLLRRGGVFTRDFWNLNDRFAYWVLFPALLFYKTSTIDLTFDLLKSYATVILGAFVCVVVLTLLVLWIVSKPRAVASSVFQGALRHNTFLALAVAETLFGDEGLAIATMGTAMLVPFTNLTVVPVVTVMVQDTNQKGVFKIVVAELARNPLLLSVIAGIAVNFSGIGEIPVVHNTTHLMGQAALPIALLCVGANIHVRSVMAAARPVVLAVFLKMIIFPILIFIFARAVGLSDMETLVALLFGAVPAGPGAYSFARQIGGDAPLMAGIVTIQTALSFVTIPITITVASYLMG